MEQALRIVRRRKWIVLQALIAVPLMALALSIRQEEMYTATATLLFRETPATLEESAAVVDPTREAATNGQLVALPVVARQASEELEGRISAGEIFGATTVEPSSNADTATVSSESNTPERAAEIANAYGQAYINFRRKADREQV